MSSPHPSAPPPIPVLATGPQLRLDHRQDQRHRPAVPGADPLVHAASCIGFTLLQGLMLAIYMLLFKGIGVWGINIPVGWGFDIINFVWWIGIGHAGTLISAILLLFRQQWRTSINRFAEAMTLFAVACARLFPLFHTGRPWLPPTGCCPYPNTMGVWPQFRSPLIWDVFAVSTYAHGLGAVLVRRPDPRPGDAARSRAIEASARSSTASWRSAGAARRGTGTTTRRPT